MPEQREEAVETKENGEFRNYEEGLSLYVRRCQHMVVMAGLDPAIHVPKYEYYQ